MPADRRPGPAREEAGLAAYRAEGSRSRRLHERALAVMPGGNSRHSLAPLPHPVYLASRRGCPVQDVESEERIGFLNNFTSLIHGHADPEVCAAVQAQVARGTAFAAPTEADVELAELLVERIPSVERIRFCNSGTEAVMLAIKAARAFTGRPRIAKIEGAYHGLYDHAQTSESSSPESWGPADRPASVIEAGSAPSVASEVVVMPWNDGEACERLIEENAPSLAAVILDPLPLGLGLLAPAEGFLQRLRDVTREHGILLVGDEVLNFRLGYHGAFHAAGIRCDLTCLG